ncbi:GlxA family transcriptional regulator [Leisingera sp. NJS204]|uniref:GlxA family transcriptional regulator n=1 Tax=Leisingera sp. NJS204 TaxID=2508307 RepID=UPI0010105B95|nr:helix-turn-helix domain-containing protein [Leisingera sp. NJS204]QAX28412.1 helix-turn-helix domain-containing protein [Leisingera sp. NJS204]
MSGTFEVRHLSPDGRPYTDTNGRRVTPQGCLEQFPKPRDIPKLVIVPGLNLDPHAQPPESFEDAAEWLRMVADAGALITSTCSGAWLLAHAGLLNGLEATTHWNYAETLTRLYPKVRLRRERVLAPAGAGHSVVTAGGASCWGDLMLYLIARFAGAHEARRIAKEFLLQPHSDGQLCYASLVATSQHDDQLIAEAQVWAAQHYDTPSPVATMAERSGMTQRGFHRRFRKATGQAPVDYIQTLRVEEAKQLLETTAAPIDEIASEVGYSEPSSFRSAFRKRVGISASAYRKKWRALAPMDT